MGRRTRPRQETRRHVGATRGAGSSGQASPRRWRTWYRGRCRCGPSTPCVEDCCLRDRPQGALRWIGPERRDVALASPPGRARPPGTGSPPRTGKPPGGQHSAAGHRKDEEGVRARLLLDERSPGHRRRSPVPPARPGSPRPPARNNAGSPARTAAAPNLICSASGPATPQIAFTHHDVMVAQGLAASGLGVALLPDLRIAGRPPPGGAHRAARRPPVSAGADLRESRPGPLRVSSGCLDSPGQGSKNKRKSVNESWLS